MPPQQYQYPQQYQQSPQQHFSEPQSTKNEDIELNNPILKNLQHSVILFMLLILFNNSGFQNFLSKIPFTLDIDGNQTIFMSFIIFLVIFLFYFLYLNIFN